MIETATLPRTALPLCAGIAVALAASPLAAQTPTSAKSEGYAIQVETIADGLEHPWGLALLPDGRFLVTERNPGTIRIGSREGKLSEPLQGVPEVFRYEGPTNRSQGGMFHVALHPDFAQNNLVYFSFSQRTEEGGAGSLARARLVENGTTARLEDVEVLFSENKPASSGVHYGGRFAFNPKDNSVVLTIGDRGWMARSQDAEDHAGSIVRVTEDGQVPKDNPFLKDDDKDDHIYSWGHRNIQGIAFHPETGELWVNEHGPKGGDEINRIRAGENYGWPMQTSAPDYSGAPVGEGEKVKGFASAVHVFEDTVAPSGLAFYQGDMFGEWQGDMLHGALTGQGIVRTRLKDDKVTDEEWIELGRRIRDVQVAEDGSIWLLTEHEDGEILRLSAVDTSPKAKEKAPAKK